MRLLRAWSLLLLLPVMLTTGVGQAYSLFRCRNDATVRRSCCCPEESVFAPQPSAAISEACCCDFETVRIAPQPSDEAGAHLVVLTPVRVATALLPLPVAADAGAATSTPVGLGPPIIVAKQSFLI